MSGRLLGKVVLITGAARGIGRVAALLFGQEGAHLALADIDEDGGLSLLAEVQALGRKAHFFKIDLTDAQQVKQAVDEIVKYFGRIDVLYNNAAINHFGKAGDVLEEDWDRVMAVNVKGTFLTCKYVIPIMAEQAEGVIINTGSAASFVGLRNLAAYTASKGAVLQLTRNLALDYAQDGIRVNAICPGVTATEMTEKIINDDPDPKEARARFDRVIPRGSIAAPIEIANVALFLASDESSYITGAAIPVDGGYTAE